MDQIIFHIDVNSAFLSWTAVEELKNGGKLDLRQVPSVIGHDDKSHRGVVLAKSQFAKPYHIVTGEPLLSAIRKCPNLVIRQPNHQLYKTYSHRLMELLYNLTSEIEQLSIDECFLNFSSIAHNYSSVLEGANSIKELIFQTLGFTVNIGVSSNKVLAKMASDFKKPNLVHTLFPEEIEKKMWSLPVQELYMAGKSSVEILKNLEILTIGDLAKADPNLLVLHLKSHGRTLWEYANGIASSFVNSSKQEVKGIGNSMTLSQDINSYEEVQLVLKQLANKVSFRLKKEEQLAGNICIEIKYHDFASTSHQTVLFTPTSHEDTLYENACNLFLNIWNGDFVRLLGIRVSKLVPQNSPTQLNLFDGSFSYPISNSANPKKRNLEKALSSIRHKYGEDAIKKGSALQELDS